MNGNKVFFKRNLIDKGLFLSFFSSLTFIVLAFFIGNLFQPIYGLEDFNFVAAGDWGCTSNTDATVSNINGKNPEPIFGFSAHQ